MPSWAPGQVPDGGGEKATSRRPPPRSPDDARVAHTRLDGRPGYSRSQCGRAVPAASTCGRRTGRTGAGVPASGVARPAACASSPRCPRCPVRPACPRSRGVRDGRSRCRRGIVAPRRASADSTRAAGDQSNRSLPRSLARTTWAGFGVPCRSFADIVRSSRAAWSASRRSATRVARFPLSGLGSHCRRSRRRDEPGAGRARPPPVGSSSPGGSLATLTPSGPAQYRQRVPGGGDSREPLAARIFRRAFGSASPTSMIVRPRWSGPRAKIGATRTPRCRRRTPASGAGGGTDRSTTPFVRQQPTVGERGHALDSTGMPTVLKPDRRPPRIRRPGLGPPRQKDASPRGCRHCASARPVTGEDPAPHPSALGQTVLLTTGE